MVHYEWFTRRRYVHFCGIHFNHYYNPDFLKYSWDWMAIALLPEWKRQNAKGVVREICCEIPERTRLGMPHKPIGSALVLSSSQTTRVSPAEKISLAEDWSC